MKQISLKASIIVSLICISLTAIMQILHYAIGFSAQGGGNEALIILNILKYLSIVAFLSGVAILIYGLSVNKR